MVESDFETFQRMLDSACGLISRGRYTPNAEAAAIFFEAMRPYTLRQFSEALTRHMKDPERGKFAPVPADLIAKIDLAGDGRPGPEEAWAMIPDDESATVVWTDEMADAYGLCAPLLARRDRVGARMAFKERYERSVALARHSGLGVRWSVSLGHDLEQRKRALMAAVEAGRITAAIAHEAMPALPAPAEAVSALPPPNEKAKAGARAELRMLAGSMRTDPADPLAWAKDLRTKEQGGIRLTDAQRKAWRDALDRTTPQQPGGSFNPIPDHLLPPGMRKGRVA